MKSYHITQENKWKFEPEPLPDAQQAPKKRGRPKRSAMTWLKNVRTLKKYRAFSKVYVRIN